MADRRCFGLTPGQSVRTRTAGLFLFLPLLAQLRFQDLVSQAGYPGSRMIPATMALLSLLTLKLLDKERHSHIDDFNFDPALGWFAGLNVLPKKSFASDYSYRTQRRHQHQLLSLWIKALSAILCPQAHAFALDFHVIPFRGDPEALANHYLPLRGKAGPSVLSFFAYEPESRLLCYGNANLTRQNQAQEVMQFVEFWKTLSGGDPQWLYLDSKATTYAELSRLHERKIWFVTIRRRGAAVLRRLSALPSSAWRPMLLEIPKRRRQRVRYVDESLPVRGFEGTLRQVAVDGLGRRQATLFLSNNQEVLAREIVRRYLFRNGVEDGLGVSVNFFHLDCLASEVRLNVDVDVALTVIAQGCYRWLASRLHGFSHAKAKSLYRKCVETPGVVRITSEKIVVRFDRRSHNPLIQEAALDTPATPVPWLGDKPVRFEFA